MGQTGRPEKDIASADGAASRALSVAEVENDFVAAVYTKLSSFYDLIFGPPLEPGRRVTLARMAIRPGDSILEVGVGTGLSAILYPPHCSVVGIDLSESMLEKARERVARRGMGNVRLLEMDAADLKFQDDQFDVVYAPYLISVVPDPVAVAKEMKRVCKPGGRVIFLNHFQSSNGLLAGVERLISPFTVHIGFKTDLDLNELLALSGLRATLIEKVNLPRLWKLVVCEKPN